MGEPIRGVTQKPLAVLMMAASALLLASCAAAPAPSSQAARILTGQAHSAEGAISIETGDWTYAVPLDGVSWTDWNGVWHDSGRPECLPPSEQTIPVTFAAVEVNVEGMTWRPVVWISCEG